MRPARLIDALGGRYSRELGIDLAGADPGRVFRWFLASKLLGARIASTCALRTYREFERRGVLSADRIRGTGWDGLVSILDAGGYARYDFSTATRLIAIAEDLIGGYGGDLNVLHGAARDSRDLEERLKSLGKGIGDVTVNIFLRELRGIWTKSRPALSPAVLLAARRLGVVDAGGGPLPALERFWTASGTTGHDFCDFEAALLRLGKDYCRKRRCGDCPLGNACPDRAKA